MASRDRFELLILGVIWGASFLFTRVAVPEFGAFALVELRIGVAAVFLIGSAGLARWIRSLARCGADR